MDRLQGIYNYYCAFAPAASSLDNVKWKKAVTDMGLIDKTVTVTDIDLIFTKVWNWRHCATLLAAPVDV